MFTLLRQRNFALLWSGQAISAIGDWILWIGLPFYVYGQTGSAMAAGAMFMARTLPPLLLGSVAGVFVDQWERRRILIVVDLLRALLMLLMIIAVSPHWLWIIYPLNFLDALSAQFFNPAKSALVPRLVDPAQLLAANTLNSLSDDLTMLIGPALGGVLMGQIGFAGVVLLDALSFLFSASLLLLIKPPPHSPPTLVAKGARSAPIRWEAMRQDWWAGLRQIKQNRLVTALFIVMGIAMSGQGIIFVLWAVFVKQVLQGGAPEYGWVQVAVAAGGLCGAALLGRIGKQMNAAHLIGCSGIVTGLLLLATFHLPMLFVILALQFVNGIAAIGFFVPNETLLQQSVADDYRGRVFGAYHTTNALCLLAGQAVASAFGDRVGVVPLLDGAGALYSVSGVAALILLGAGMLRHQPAASQPQATRNGD